MLNGGIKDEAANIIDTSGDETDSFKTIITQDPDTLVTFEGGVAATNVQINGLLTATNGASTPVSYTGNITISTTGSGTPQVQAATLVGKITRVTIAANANLNITDYTTQDLSGLTNNSGAGTVRVVTIDNATLTPASLTEIDTFIIGEGTATVTAANVVNLNIGATNVTIDGGATLNITALDSTTTADLEPITGSGTANITTTANFSFTGKFPATNCTLDGDKAYTVSNAAAFTTGKNIYS